MLQWLVRAPKRTRKSRKRFGFESLENRTVLTTLLPGPHKIPDFVHQPTITTIASGDWDDPLIWSSGLAPAADDRALVSAGHSVVLNDDGVDVRAIGVHGILETSASLRVEDFVVYEDGVLNMLDGTELVFADGPLDLENDPLQWGTGLIVQGQWNALGTEKTPYVRSTHDISLGATSFVADVTPEGWEVGDVLVLPETAQSVVRKKGGRLEHSELVTIASIDGNAVHFTQGATFDHNGISPNPFNVERFAHVANLTRPIVIRSENPDGVRGHTVVTHSAQVDIQNVAFVGLGRTRADSQVDNTLFSENGEVLHIGTNQIGRYPFHAHHLHGDYSITGSVVQDGLKWGITIHQTDNGLVQNNIVYDVDGAGIATEDGVEVDNQFIGNLVIKVDGGYQTGSARAGATRTFNLVGNEFIDTGSEGSGFWFRGPGSFVEGNTVYDAAGYGFNFNGYYRKGDLHQVRSFRGNEVVSSRGGLWATWSQVCCNTQQYERQVFEEFLVWHISHNGVLTYHEAEITLRDVTVVSNPNTASTNQGSETRIDVRTTTAFHLGNPSYENFNFVLENIKASGANIGIFAPVRAGSDGALLDGAHFQNYINVAFNNGADPDELNIQNVQFSPTFVKRISSRYPAQPANVWSSVEGVLEVGQAAAGASGADGPSPIILPEAVDLLDGGRLKISGSAAKDIVTISETNGVLQLMINGGVATIPRQQVSRIEFFGHGDDDTFDNQSSVRAIALGGNGNDTLIAGGGGDTMQGEAGNDLLVGNFGNDILYGGHGDDELLGNAGNDKLRGENGDDLIFGGKGGDRVLLGGAGDDRIDGGEGNDHLGGDAGADILLGGAGDDSFHGGVDNDLLIGESGNDILYGDDGDDEFLGGGGSDKFRPGAGNDLIFASLGDQLFTDDNDDVRQFSDAREELMHFGEERLKRIFEEEFGLSEQEAIDRLETYQYLNAAVSQFHGSRSGVIGEPILLRIEATYPSPQDQTNLTYQIDWGDGGALEEVTSPGAGVSATHRYADDGRYTITARVRGDDGGVSDAQTREVEISDWRLVGDAFHIGGTDGRDEIYLGYHPNDPGKKLARINGAIVVLPDVDRYVVFGGEGDDIIDNRDVRFTETLELHGGPGSDYLRGGRGDDILNGDDGRDFLEGRYGQDQLYGDEGNDVIRGDSGEDQLFGGPGHDGLFGGRGDDVLRGEDGRDVLYGEADNDILLGGEQSDRIYDSFGYNLMIGGGGRDLLSSEPDPRFPQLLGGNALMIGSSTQYDASSSNDLALQSILAEWSNDGQSIDLRRIHIVSGDRGGLSGGFPLSSGSGVIDDQATDYLRGGGDGDLFYNLGSRDVVFEQDRQDRLAPH